MKIKIEPRKFILFLQTSETAFLLFFSISIGMGAGFGAVFFRWLIGTFETLFFGGGRTVLSFMGSYYVLLVPVAGGLIVGPIIYFFAREVKGHGVPEVMLAVATLGGKIRPRVAVLKAFVSSVCIGSGGSAGREGPIVQIGSALGSSLGQLFRLSEERIKILIACGAAGGIAATFNAPLSGIFFALEVILMSYGYRFFSAVVLSSVTATVVSRHFLGDHPAFMIPQYQLVSIWEIPLYFIFGFWAALTALLFIGTLYKCEDIFDAWKVPEYIKPAAGGLLIGAIGVFFPEVFGVGYTSIEQALYGEVALWLVVVLVFLKIAATSLTLGSGGSGGVFAPSLFIGAMLGSAFGKLAHIIIPVLALSPSAYALVGMGAVFAGASQAPLSAIIIIFEMTGNYRIILPLMITCIISAVMVRRFSKESIYTLKLKRRGIDVHKLARADMMERIIVSRAILTDSVTVNEETSVRDADLLIKTTNKKGFPVLDNKGNLTGVITYRDIKAVPNEKSGTTVKEIMTRDIVVCYPDESLRTALERLVEGDIGRIPVVDRNNRSRFIGLITRESIIAAYTKAMKEEERRK